MTQKYDYSELLPEFEASGLSLTEWSKMKGYNVKTMSSGMRRERAKRENSENGNGFVKVSAQRRSCVPLRIRAGKAEIEVDSSSDLELLGRVVEALA